MPTTQIDGLISGLDTSGIIRQLSEVARRPQKLLQARIDEANGQKVALLSLSAKLLALASDASKIADPRTYGTRNLAVSNPSVLTASGGEILTPGSYRFQVERLASAHQFSSAGFADRDSTPVGAGTITLEDRRAALDGSLALSALDEGQGITRGAIRITDRTGRTAEVDLRLAATVADVIDAIQRADVGVRAEVSADGTGLDLIDTSGGGGLLDVAEVDGGGTARSLGVLGTAAGGRLFGRDVLNFGSKTLLADLNDTRGVRQGVGVDFLIDVGGVGVSVDLEDAKTLGEVKTAIEAAATTAGADLQVSLDSAGAALVLTDGGGGAITVTDVRGTAADLGLLGAPAGPVLQGARLHAGLDSTLLQGLNGGRGVGAGAIQVTSRAGGPGTVIDLSGARTVRDVLRAIRDAGAGVEARISAAGNGIGLVDRSGGAGNLVVAEAGGTTAADLGLLTDPAGVAADQIEGKDLDRQVITQATALADLGPNGFHPGAIRVVNRLGESYVVDLSQADDTEVADVIEEINAIVGGVTARINDSGDGILLEDTTGGTGALRVLEEKGGRTAADLRLLGSASAAAPNRIDGAFSTRLEISATDTLNDVARRINEAGGPVQAAVFQDGGAGKPFRLVLTARDSGAAGRALVDTRSTLSFREVSVARDAAVLYGDGEGAILLTSSTNTMRGVVGGLTLDLASKGDVAIQVSMDYEKSVTAVRTFVDRFNSVRSDVDSVTSFDPETNERGILLGDTTVSRLRRKMAENIIRPVRGTDGTTYVPANFGLTVSMDGRLLFDESKFQAKLAEDPEAVQSLLGAKRPLEATTRLAEFNRRTGVQVNEQGNDLEFRLADGTTFSVDLGRPLRVEDVLASVNGHPDNGGKVSLRISDDRRSLVAIDHTTGNDTFSIRDAGTAQVRAGLGLNGVVAGNTLTGRPITLPDDPGLGHVFRAFLDQMTAAQGGALQERSDAIDKRVESIQKTLDRSEARVKAMEERLSRQFTNLEKLLGQSQATMERLSQQFSQLSNATRSRK